MNLARGCKLAAPAALTGRLREFVAAEAARAGDRLLPGRSERLFFHLWAPAGAPKSLDLSPEADDALRPPRALKAVVITAGLLGARLALLPLVA